MIADVSSTEVDIDALTPRQRAQLRSLAHPLKPILQIGKEGITETVVRSLQDAFNTRELLKVKVQRSAPLTAAEAGEALVSRLSDVQWVQTIGRTVVLFRRHPTRPEIELPAGGG